MKTELRAELGPVLQCPRCRQPRLDVQSAAIHCGACGAAYPIRSGVANFLLADSEVMLSERWVEAQSHEKRFWDEVGAVPCTADDGVHVFAREHAKAQYSRFLALHQNVPPSACLEIGAGNVPRIMFTPARLKIALDPLMSQQARFFPEAYADMVCFDAVGEAIPLVDGCIDYAVMSNCLDHFSKPELALREVFRVLRPNGIVFISLETFNPWWKIWHKYRDRAHPYRWTANEQRAVIANSGGRILEFAVDPPIVREYYRAVWISPKQRLAVALKKMQTSWIFVAKA